MNVEVNIQRIKKSYLPFVFMVFGRVKQEITHRASTFAPFLATMYGHGAHTHTTAHIHTNKNSIEHDLTLALHLVGKLSDSEKTSDKPVVKCDYISLLYSFFFHICKKVNMQIETGRLYKQNTSQ